MKKYNRIKNAVFAAALAMCIVISGCGIHQPIKSYAMAMSDQLEKALEEELKAIGGVEELEDSEIDQYDMDIDQFAEEYFKKMENGEIGVKEYIGERIVNPKLTMKLTNDGNIRYTLPNGSYYDVTEPNGIITGSPVTFYHSSDVIGFITKDGERIRPSEPWYFAEPGNYHIQMLFYRVGEGSNGDVYEVNHYFMIAGDTLGNFGMVTAPDGFRITSVKKDGVPQPITNPNGVFLEGDGHFEIRYQDSATESVYTVTSFDRDTTAPFLRFSKEIAQGPVEGPVEYYTNDASDIVYVSYNGNTAAAVDNMLTAEGVYSLEVRDRVGNSRVYRIEIKRDYQLFDTKLVILTLIFLLGSGIHFLLLRREVKVI